MARRDQGVTRRIYFYRLEHKDEILKVLPGDLARILNLPFTENGRYLAEGEDYRLVAWPDALEFPLKLRFGKTRLSNLPTKERLGKLEALDLAIDEGLVELCHVIIYDDGFVAAEFNFEGPRIKRLGDYLYAKRQQLSTRPNFLPLFQRDILALVQGMPVIKLLELKGRPSAATLLAKADQNLGHAYGALGNLGANESIELGLSAENRPESKLKELSVKLASLVKSNRGDVGDEMRRLRVRGFTSAGRIDEVDLLEDHLIAVKTIARQEKKGKALSQSSAYEQIDAAYRERRDELHDAVAGRRFFG